MAEVVLANEVEAGDSVLWAGRRIEVVAVRIVKFNKHYRSLAFDCLVPEIGNRTLFWRSDEVVTRVARSGRSSADPLAEARERLVERNAAARSDSTPTNEDGAR